MLILSVVHCKKSPFDIYIGRPSKWGNPFIIGKDGDREEVVQKYREWILTQPELLLQLHELEGKVLGCWCAPQACHGDVLVDLLQYSKIGPQKGPSSVCKIIAEQKFVLKTLNLKKDD